MFGIVKTIHKHLRARHIRSICITRWTERFIPIVQEELYPLPTDTDPDSIEHDTIEQAAYLRAVSLVNLLSDLARPRKDELKVLRMMNGGLSDNLKEDLKKMSNDLRDKRIERLFHV